MLRSSKSCSNIEKMEISSEIEGTKSMEDSDCPFLILRREDSGPKEVDLFPKSCLLLDSLKSLLGEVCSSDNGGTNEGNIGGKSFSSSEEFMGRTENCWFYCFSN